MAKINRDEGAFRDAHRCFPCPVSLSPCSLSRARSLLIHNLVLVF